MLINKRYLPLLVAFYVSIATGCAYIGEHKEFTFLSSNHFDIGHGSTINLSTSDVWMTISIYVANGDKLQFSDGNVTIICQSSAAKMVEIGNIIPYEGGLLRYGHLYAATDSLPSAGSVVVTEYSPTNIVTFHMDGKYEAHMQFPMGCIGETTFTLPTILINDERHDVPAISLHGASSRYLHTEGIH